MTISISINITTDYQLRLLNDFLAENADNFMQTVPEEMPVAKEEAPKSATKKKAAAKKTTKKAAAKKEAPAEEETPVAETPSEVSMDDVRSKLIEVVNACGGQDQQAAKDLVGKYDAQTITELKEEHYASVVTDADAWLAQKAEEAPQALGL